MFIEDQALSITPLGFDSNAWGQTAVLLHPSTMEKVASATHTPERLLEFIANLKPRSDGRYLLLNALGAGEYWGCFTKDNIIQTDRGFLSIRDVRKGDLVESHVGHFREVLTKYEFNHHTKGVSVGVSGLIDPIICTEKHEFFSMKQEAFTCSRDRYQRCLPDTKGTRNICRRPTALKEKCAETEQATPTFVPVDELRLKDFLLCPLPKHDQKANMSLLKARVAGFWVAEGSFIHQRSALSQADGLEFSFATSETGFVDQVAEYGRRRGIIQHGPYPGHGDCVSIRLMDSVLAYEYKKLFGEYSEGKKIPYNFVHQPEDVILEFLSGYFDGDGTVNHKDSCVTATTASKNLALGIQRLLWSVRIPVTVCPVKKQGHFRINFSIERGLNLYTRMTKGDKHTSLGKSHHQQIFIDGYVALPIRKLKRVSLEGEPTYDLEVEEEHSYVLGQVAVHNSNKNGDYFPEWSLKGEDPPNDIKEFIRSKNLAMPSQWGYRTFEQYAYPFRHHNNKDPIHAIGPRVCCAAYNDMAHRIELVIFILESKAPDLVRRIDAGESIPWSMGAKLLWDLCSVCRNAARNKSQYCDHLKNDLNKTYEDGRKVFAYNYFPRFFDISAVFTPADKSAYSLRKVASDQSFYNELRDIEPERAAEAMCGMEKFAGVLDFLSTGGEKSATIEKDIPPISTSTNLGTEPIKPEIWSMLFDMVSSDREECEDIPEKTLGALRHSPLSKALGAITSLGIVLKPGELDQLSGGREIPESLDFGNHDHTLLSKLKRFVHGRSMLEPHFRARVIRLRKRPSGDRKRRLMLTKESSAYEKYKKLLTDGVDLEKLAEAVEDKEVREALYPDAFEKEIIGIDAGPSSFDHTIAPFIALVSQV